MPVSTDTFSYPKQTSGTTVYYPGEEGSITASDLDFGRVNLTMKKRAIYSLVSNELKDDAMVSIVDLLAQDMGYQFALKEDSEGIIGDGTSTYGGVQGIRPALIAATASHRYGGDRARYVARARLCGLWIRDGDTAGEVSR